MKFLKPLCFILFFCISCNNSTDEIEIITKEKSSDLNLRSVRASDKEEEEVEQLMFMTSFLIGKTLLENEAARNYFYQHIQKPEIDNLELTNILDADSYDSNPFEIAFHEQFNTYNWHLNPQSGAPDPPKSTSLDPDPLKWGGILKIYYQEYLIKIIKLNKWKLFFPNKNFLTLNNYKSFSDYFKNNKTITCLWKNIFSNDITLFDDGVILYDDGTGEYLPRNFSLIETSSFVFILKAK